MKKQHCIYLIIFIGMIGVLIIQPIPQDVDYHNFADNRRLFGVDNFFNVFSNLPFILVGVYALSLFQEKNAVQYVSDILSAYVIFFIGLALIGLGSAYYHLEPNNETLFWDRLPMTVSFMAFVVIVVAEYISVSFAKQLLYPLISVGVVSVLYWDFTESRGVGDLRFYALVQFLPMLVVPIIMWKNTSRYSHEIFYWGLLGLYVLAKVFEILDHPVYMGIGISGHTIKHLLAAAGPFLVLQALMKRSEQGIAQE